MAREPETYERIHHQVKWTCGLATWIANFTDNASLEDFKTRMTDGCAILDIKTRYY